MKSVSLKCMDCGMEMAKVTVPAARKASGEQKPSSCILCIPCAEKARQMRQEKLQEKIAVIY